MMHQLKYIIVDDEPIAHRIIEKYCADFAFMQLAGNCDDAFEALSLLGKERIDVMFLDINMPHLKGLDLLKSLQNPPVVVITSAYQEYAVEGFELNVCDYLLKPFSPERFKEALQKARSRIEQKQARRQASGDKDYVFVRSQKKLLKVAFAEIRFVESFRTYIVVQLEGGKALTLNRNITEFAGLLPGDRFVRVHRSFIIAIDKIDAIVNNTLTLGDRQIPMGKVYKDNLLKLLP